MGLFDDALKNATADSSMSKTLIVAAGALLLSKMFGGSGASAPEEAPQASIPAPGTPVTPDQADTGNDGGLLDNLGGLVDKFRQAGAGSVIDSWIGHGQNQNIQPGQLGQVLGDDALQELSKRTGASQSDILSQLAQALPGLINSLTPNGRLPNRGDLGQ